MGRKRIAWFTIDSFVDCDFIPIDYVSKYYDIDWFIVLPKEGSRYHESDFNEYSLTHPNLRLFFLYEKYRIRDPRRIAFAYKFGKRLVKTEADLFYINTVATSPWFSALWWQLPKDNKIITAHQGEVHAGMKFKNLSNLSRDLIYKHASVVNLFSDAQASLFEKRYPNRKIYIIRLSLKDYGIPTIPHASSRDECVNFLFFGLINFGKNVEILIDAACNLYERGVRNFKVKICGTCKSWNYYQQRIKYPEIFDLSIGFVDNSYVPNLFAEMHYCVQPYRAVSQSGVMKVAFQYNTPVIVSNLPGFMDELVEGVNGFSFKTEDVKDLEAIMKERIDNFKNEYDELVANMANHTKATYSPDSIGQKYVSMFNEVLSVEKY